MTSLQYPTVHAVGSFGNLNVNMPVAAMQYDANGRLDGMTMDDLDGYGPQPLAAATYTPTGQLHTLSWGSYTETRTYNSLMQLTNQSIPYVMNMTYNYSATHNNGRIVSSADGITGENTNYTYDALNRLTAASNASWSEAYGYDGFGNLTSKSGSGGSPNVAPTMTATYNNHNQNTSVTYDANGNSGGSFNVENRLVAQWNGDGSANLYSYDPWGKRVMSGHDSSPYSDPQPVFTYAFYGITGQKLMALTCNGSDYPGYPTCAIVGQNVYFGKKLIVSGGVSVVTDRLGSVRANSLGESFAYYPYGEERTSTVDGREKFGTYFRDMIGQEYADQRYYNSGAGSFMTVDPGGMATAKLKRPGSWNRYGYAQGDPVNHTDRHGLYLDAQDCINDPDVCEEEDWCDGYGDGLGFLGQADPGCPNDGGGDDEPPTPDCSAQFGGSWGLWSGFVLAHYSDTVSLGAEAELPSDWIMAWASVESSWGQGPVFVPTGNYFGWAGVGDVPCAGGATTFHNDGCFSSFEASAMTALFSTNNFFSYGGYTGVSAAAILADNASVGPSAAFQALANAGFNTNPVNGPKYAATIASRVGLIDKVEDCLRTKGEIQ